MPPTITFARARELFRYDAESGLLYRRHTLREKTGRAKSSGYLVVNVGGRIYQAHRLIWFLTHGRWPAGEIDHINGVKADNRLSNLRDVSHAVNVRNQASCTRIRLVGPVPDGDRWKVVLPDYERSRELGPFETFAAADEAFGAAAKPAFESEGRRKPRLWINGSPVEV